MANLKEIRTRISSVQKTKQVTAAMKMVSAAKLKKAQDAIVQIRPYADKLHEILSNLTGSLNPDDNLYGVERRADRILLIAITSNKGLCGAFNSNVIKQVNVLTEGIYADQNEKGHVDVLCIGKQANEILKKTHKVIGERNSLYDDLSFLNVAKLAESIMAEFVEGKYDKVELVYNQFKNAGVQILTTEQFLPVQQEEEENHVQAEYIFEPNKEEIVQDLIPKSLKTQFFKAMLDSFASEHGARMTAMHKATDNASDLLQDLNLTYNKARQAAITNEILEIVSGANALAQ
ncbi:ATP synthase F1 subunit gamma [Marinifilum caeruleilacunae]|uniref:ATP synthase gamma chain n=1 Tax=Marinifilum caeruleilacunae TaxID=2499076 RepID=A0ABX1WV93_9BACT|nr:ATP synthase F1 subunit gamma [Marinifilum caeruleilacunae]NOU59866.1 ATP synthase F1 subunit gamma [Marinifilum caeruleilacunae]